ncbi:Hypothetical protein FKW44_024462 [Caligus rogercresseyi]|uniref:Uncharacterized protein n=1 Tax=Caligus rogercresseyi TaxID=217165 RepID=A0A7T8JUH7_CALRO|nr:Hypothetical protein FKW44_024462 [Caligus rogercresseyi]
MIERILEQGPAIRRVLDDRRTQHLIPSWQDIDVMESVNAALKRLPISRMPFLPSKQ